MSRATLSPAHRLYSFSAAMVASFARADIPYAVQLLLLLQLTELLLVWARTGLGARPATSSRH